VEISRYSHLRQCKKAVFDLVDFDQRKGATRLRWPNYGGEQIEVGRVAEVELPKVNACSDVAYLPVGKAGGQTPWNQSRRLTRILNGGHVNV
jgi:hypothetical protein